MPAEAVAVVKTALDAAAAARSGDVGIDLFSVRIQKCTSFAFHNILNMGLKLTRDKKLLWCVNPTR